MQIKIIRWHILNHTLVTDILSMSSENALWWMPQDFSVVSRRYEGVILDLSQSAMLWQLGITTSRLTSHGELMVHAGCGAMR